MIKKDFPVWVAAINQWMFLGSLPDEAAYMQGVGKPRPSTAQGPGDCATLNYGRYVFIRQQTFIWHLS